MDISFLTTGRSKKNRRLLNDMKIRKEFEKEQKEKLKKEQRYEQMNTPGFLIPKPIENKYAKIVEETPLMKQGIIPSHPESVSFVGGSGSGKSTVLAYMLLNFYKDYFSEIHLFAFTGESDDTFKVLKIKKNKIYTTDLIEKLDEVLDKQKSLVESKSFNKTKPVLLILEDITSSKKFLRSQACIRAFTLGRHLNASIWACSHKYTALPPVCRLKIGRAHV